MKTTIEIPDDLLEEAKVLARADRTTLRSLVVEGLRWAISRRKQKTERFTLRDAGMSGRGVQPGVTEGNWEELGELIYRGRGG
jgi:hypothetical protein